jgi:DNA protecting protein DprA
MTATPPTLRLIYNLPPFLFIRGAITDADLRSVAVVGIRTASADGISRAGQLARLLAGEDVTVVSGLARGIDTAAHTAALEAGGRTIAVIGTGINRYYPAENRALADQITKRGAVASQFWPDSPPTTYTFPRRNITMSGIAQGTVVIEASSTSGAKMQARLALDQKSDRAPRVGADICGQTRGDSGRGRDGGGGRARLARPNPRRRSAPRAAGDGLRVTTPPYAGQSPPLPGSATAADARTWRPDPPGCVSGAPRRR